MMQIPGSVALVTGGNRGIGRAIVDELLAQGATKVYATSRAGVEPAGDPRVVPLALEVTADGEVESVAHAAGDVSILVNNAGGNRFADLLTAPLDDIRTDLDVNLLGALRLSRAFAPILARHTQSAILNVNSATSWLSYGTGYDVSKAAAWSATDGLRLLLADQGTTVTGLYVGLVDTDLVRAYDMPKLEPADVARQAVEGIAAGVAEVLADHQARENRAKLSGPVEARYEGIVPLRDVIAA